MKTDTSEKGLEALIVKAMTDRGWLAGDPADYNREYAIDLKQLTVFLDSTQPDICRASRPSKRQSSAAEVPRTASGRNQQAGHD